MALFDDVCQAESNCSRLHIRAMDRGPSRIRDCNHWFSTWALQTAGSFSGTVRRQNWSPMAVINGILSAHTETRKSRRVLVTRVDRPMGNFSWWDPNSMLLTMLTSSQQSLCYTWPQWAGICGIRLEQVPGNRQDQRLPPVLSGMQCRLIARVDSTHGRQGSGRCNGTAQQARKDPACPPAF